MPVHVGYLFGAWLMRFWKSFFPVYNMGSILNLLCGFISGLNSFRICILRDFVLEEMVWLSGVFQQEIKMKKAASKKCARMVQKHFTDKALVRD